ncbi:MAG: VOC family protein [Acetobacteraceae bacterium]|nr:VOC family protein [Acetobacteraceae bacterium]
MIGTFVWHEILTTDTAAARAFYTDVVGWTARDSGVPGMDYTLLLTGETRVAGLMRQPDGAGQPGWVGYVGVEDVDAGAAKAVSLGGAVLMPPRDIPNVGRFAVIADPQGAAIAIFRGDGMPARPAAMAPGSIGWNELSATDMPAVWPFYAGLFGWREERAMDMGPMGTYRIFAAGDAVLGGMMTRSPGTPGPYWAYYIAVADIDAATARATAGGAKVLMGPMEVPGGAWVIQGSDPQGVMFALVGGRGK